MATTRNKRQQGLTVEEFLALPEEEGCRLELSRGRVAREPAPGPLHGAVAGRLYARIRGFVDAHGLGSVFFDTGFTLSRAERIVRVPDIAFVSAARIPREGFTEAFWELAPDLVVEIVSPSNQASLMQEKALDYLAYGAGAVWLVDPAQRTVTDYRSRSDIRVLLPGEVVEGGDALPGLEIPVGELFD